MKKSKWPQKGSFVVESIVGLFDCDFVNGTFSLFLGSQKNLNHIIWTWKSNPKVSPEIMLVLKGWG
jgi:hypothetical protein